MARRKITSPQRFGVWKAWDGRCFWCREHVYFKNCEVDHVIPLDAVEGADNAAAVRAMYALSESFDFDWFENWVPACSGCNGKKNFTTINPSPSFGLDLTNVGSRAPLAKATADAVDADARKAKVLTQVEAAVEVGALSEADITELFQNLPRIVKKSAPDVVGFQQQEVLQIAPGWSVIQLGGYLRVTTDGTPD